MIFRFSSRECQLVALISGEAYGNGFLSFWSTDDTIRISVQKLKIHRSQCNQFPVPVIQFNNKMMSSMNKWQ